MSADLIATVASIRLATSDLIAALVAQGRDVGEAASLAYDLALDAADEARVSALAAPEPVAEPEPADVDDGEKSGGAQGDAEPNGLPPVVADDDGATTASLDTADASNEVENPNTAPVDLAPAEQSSEPTSATGPAAEPDVAALIDNSAGPAVMASPNNPAGLPEYTYSGDPADLPNATDWTQVGETAEGAPLFTYAADKPGEPPAADDLGGVWHLFTAPVEPVDVSGQPSA